MFTELIEMQVRDSTDSLTKEFRRLVRPKRTEPRNPSLVMACFAVHLDSAGLKQTLLNGDGWLYAGFLEYLRGAMGEEELIPSNRLLDCGEFQAAGCDKMRAFYCQWHSHLSRAETRRAYQNGIRN